MQRRWWLWPGSVLVAFGALSVAALTLDHVTAGSGWRYRRQHPDEAARGALAVKRSCNEIRLSPAGATLFEDTYLYACTDRDSVCEGTITVNHQPVGASSFTFPRPHACSPKPAGDGKSL